MALLVKLIGGGLGLASEAIHDYRARSRSQTRPEPPSPNPPAAIATPSSSRTHDPAPDYTDAPPAYVEVADEATAEALVRAGKAEYVPVGPAAAAAAYDGKQRSKASEGAGYDVEEEDGSSSSSSDDDDDDDSQDGVELDDEAWELDEMARRVAPPPPTYADHEQQAAPEEDESEEATARKEEQMMRDLVRLAGPPPRPARRIPCPVIIPQRRPRNKDRGFVRAYAPVLADCGVSQDAFLKFQEDWLVASKVSTTSMPKSKVSLDHRGFLKYRWHADTHIFFPSLPPGRPLDRHRLRGRRHRRLRPRGRGADRRHRRAGRRRDRAGAAVATPAQHVPRPREPRPVHAARPLRHGHGLQGPGARPAAARAPQPARGGGG